MLSPPSEAGDDPPAESAGDDLAAAVGVLVSAEHEARVNDHRLEAGLVRREDEGLGFSLGFRVAESESLEIERERLVRKRLRSSADAYGRRAADVEHARDRMLTAGRDEVTCGTDIDALL